MAKANELTEICIPSYYAPWWHSIEAEGHGIRVEVDDPDGEEGKGGMVRILTARQIHDAFNLLAKDDALCCGKDMQQEGYGFGCSEDADMILQQATFGEIVYG
jgi:hypothetical protein